MGPFYNGTFGGKVYRGDLLCILDGDDRWLPQKLEKEWTALQKNPGAQIAYSGVSLIDGSGAYLASWNEGLRGDPPAGDVLVEVYSKCFFRSTRSVFRNELVTHHAFQEEGHCDERLDSYWDWERKIRYTARFKAAYSGESLVEYRKHGTGFSKRPGGVHLKAFVDVYEKHLPLLKSRSPAESIYVRTNLETYIAKKQRILFKTEDIGHYSSRNVYKRIQSALKENSTKIDTPLKAELSQLLSKFVGQSIKDDLRQGNGKEALKLWFSFFTNNVGNPLSYRLFKKIIAAGR
jgi:hypothetical protein